MAQRITDRPLAGHDDVVAVQAFLSKTYRRTETGLNWEVRRWFGQFWHDDVGTLDRTPRSRFARVHLWESASGRILGVMTPEGGGDAHFQVDPKYREIEPAMLAWAEENLSVKEGEHTTLTTFALAGDDERIDMLRRSGYAIQPWGGVHRWRSLTTPLPARKAKRKYDIRGLESNNRSDIDQLTQLINAAFGRDFAPSALRNFETSPGYDPDLQLVAVRDGTVVSHVGVTIDTPSKLAIVEPVCTHPDWRGKDLATTVMCEGLVRAAAKGATRAVVGTGIDNPANRVYSKLRFDHTEVVQTWKRSWLADA